MRSFLLWLVCALAFSTSPAWAQLDLPKGQSGDRGKKEAPSLGHLPHLVCTTCDTTNYVTTIEPAAAKGEQKAWCSQCRNVRKFQRVDPASVRKNKGGLDLPKQGTGSSGEAPQPEPAAADQSFNRPQAGNQTASAQATAVAQSIIGEVTGLRSPDPSQVNSAAEGLVSLAEPGLEQARLTLVSQNGTALLVATRALLLGGNAEDAARVAQRLEQDLPPKASGALIKQAIELNPVIASPRWLAGLLEHRQKPARLAAHKQLMKLAQDRGPDGSSHPTQGWLPFLAPLLKSKKSDASYRALDVLAELTDPGVVPLLLQALGHRKSKVARRAIDILTPMQDERIDPELLVQAFGSQWILRKNAYALLTLIEREDRSMKPMLHGAHIETLLHGMDMNDPMVSNTSALALAGIGFRMEGAQTTEWLDREVMDRLVGVAAAVRFFEDRSSLIEPTLRRLQLLTGRNFGENGPLWAEWWLANRRTFRASRAAMVYSVEDHTKLSVHYVDRRIGQGFEVVGPDRMFEGDTTDDHEVYYLDALQSAELVRMLEEQGALSSAQLPGPRGIRALRGQELTIRLGASAKSFAFGPEVREPWFESLTQFMEGLRAQNAWQDFYLTSRFPDKRDWVLETWQNGGVPTAVDAREAWMRALVLNWVEGQPVGKRDRGLQTLVDMADAGVPPGPMEFDRLLKLLRAETSRTRDAQNLFALSFQATGLRIQGSDIHTPTPEAALLGERLLGAVIETFDWQGVEWTAKVFEALGSERARLAAEDASPLMRAAAGLYSLQHSGAQDGLPGEEPWLDLLSDPNPQVVTTVLEAAGRHKAMAALPVALNLASTGESAVRHVALRTLGRLGGDDARDGLTLALTDPAGEFRQSAAEGLADLRDPKAAPLMVALLRNGRQQGIQESLRRGLRNLGSQAHEPLLNALQSPHPFTRREAALLLGRQDLARATPALLRLLTEDSTDSEVVDTLVGLTCVDLRNAEDRSYSWWGWWDNVRQEDSFSWFLSACARRGLPSPQPIGDHFFRPREMGEDGRSVGSRLSMDGSAYLLQAMRFEETWLAERAWREWQRAGNRALDPLPREAKTRVHWVDQLAESLSEAR